MTEQTTTGKAILRCALSVVLLLTALLCSSCKAREARLQDIVGYGPFKLGMQLEEALAMSEFAETDCVYTRGGRFEAYSRVGPEVFYLDHAPVEAIMAIESIPGDEERVESIRLEFDSLPNQATAKRLNSQLCLDHLETYDNSLLLSYPQYPDRPSKIPRYPDRPSKLFYIARSCIPIHTLNIMETTLAFEDDEGNVLAIVLTNRLDIGRTVSIRYTTRRWYEEQFSDTE